MTSLYSKFFPEADKLELLAYKIKENLNSKNLNQLSNNINKIHFAYLSLPLMQLLNFHNFGIAELISFEKSILVYCLEIDSTIENYCDKKKIVLKHSIFISPHSYSFLNNPKKVMINPFTNIQPYDINNRYNFFPSIPIASRITIQNIKNTNSVFNDRLFLKNLIKKPFIAYQGMEFYVQLDENLIFETFPKKEKDSFYLDYKRNKKLRRIILGKNDKSNCLFFKIDEIKTKNDNEQKSIYSIIDFYSDIEPPTELFLNISTISSNIIYPPMSDNLLKKYLLFKKIFKIPSFNALKQNLKFLLNVNDFRTILLQGKKGSGKKEILNFISRKFGYNYYEKDLQKITSLKTLEKRINTGISLRPSIIHFRNFKSLIHVISNKAFQDPQLAFISFIKEFLNDFKKNNERFCDNFCCVLVFSCDKFEEMDSSDNEIKNLFDFFINMPKANEEEVKSIFQIVYEEHMNKICDNNDLKNLAGGIEWKVLNKIITEFKNQEDFELKLKKSLENLKKSPDFENLSIPNVNWDDVGGLASAKNDILDTIMLPQQYPQIFNEFMRPRTGLLFYGPPGTGKTLLAKCIATECKMNFLSVKGPELLNMYIGESEKNVREIFEKARKNVPCIIFFDELDALAPKRGLGSDSSNVMDRIVAQFLTELDGINKSGLIFVIGATNRPDLLDESLLRPGRFDKKIYLGVCEDSDSRIKVLQAQTRKLNLEKDVNFETLVHMIPDNFTGADFYGLTSQAVLLAVKRKISKINKLYERRNKSSFKMSGELDKKENPLNFYSFIEDLLIESPEMAYIQVSQIDFENALQNIKPSISLEELKNYLSLKSKYESK